MIVLHKEKIIALKPRKVSGTSFEIALSRYADEHSIITPIPAVDEKLRRQLGWRGPQNYKASFRQIWSSNGKRKALSFLLEGRPVWQYYGHIAASEAKRKLGENIWANYTKVAIIRNPFDYMISSYFWDKSIGQVDELSFEDYVLSNPGLLHWNKKNIYEINGKNIIDFMIRYDHLADDMIQFERKNPLLKGLHETFAGIKAKGHHRPKHAQMDEIYKDAARAHSVINNVCSNEIRKYGFTVPEI